MWFMMLVYVFKKLIISGSKLGPIILVMCYVMFYFSVLDAIFDRKC